MPIELQGRLKYNSEPHRKVVDALRARIEYSREKMSNYYKQMGEAEERFTAYIPASELDTKRRQEREAQGKLSYTTIEVPLSYATLMSAHTYLTTVFLSRSPVFQVAGRHGESEQQTQGMEAMLDYQAVVGEMLVPLFTWLLDPGKYSFGIIGHYWDKEILRTRQTIMQPATFLGMVIPGKPPKPVTNIVETTAYQGNRIFNVRPQDWFSDPRVSLANFQRGEFCGRYIEIPWHEVLEGEASGKFFNMDAVRYGMASNGMEGFLSRDVGGRSTDLPGSDETGWFGTKDIQPYVKGYEIVVRLSPNEWSLGKETLPELWVFTMTGGGVLMEASPLQEASNRFPFDIIQLEPEGYSFFSKSLESRLRPLNDTIAWLFNTHMYNVRAAINNMFVVDPSMVVMKDVENPYPGKAIRLKPTAYGRDVRMALSQLQVSDVTKSHIGDVELVNDLLQRIPGINDTIMGMVNSGGRKTATEVRTSTSFGVNRLKTVCEYISAMGFAPLTKKLIQRTQLNYETGLKLRLVGDLAAFSPTVLEVNPADIAGFYDFVPVDGALPVDRVAQVHMWNQLLTMMQASPQLLMQYDISKIFAWVANLGGIRNLQQMRMVQVGIQPDDVLARQAQAGNVVPLKAPGGLPAGQVPLAQTGQGTL